MTNFDAWLNNLLRRNKIREKSYKMNKSDLDCNHTNSYLKGHSQSYDPLFKLT